MGCRKHVLSYRTVGLLDARDGLHLIRQGAVQYFLTKGDLKMQWLNGWSSHSGTLFGTTLIGVNIALVVGSESARQIVSSCGFLPTGRPSPRRLIVILFGELAPMFAARRYPDHVIRHWRRPCLLFGKTTDPHTLADQ